MIWGKIDRRRLGFVVVGTALLGPFVLMGVVAFAYSWCLARGLPADLMQSCKATGRSVYLVSAVASIRRPVLVLLAVGLSLLASTRRQEDDGPTRARQPARNATLMAALLGVGVGLPQIVGAARDGSVNGGLDFLWNVIRKFWQGTSPYRYEEGCFGAGLEIECLGYLHSYVLLFAPFAWLPAQEAVQLWALANLVLVPMTAVVLALGFRLGPLGAFILGAFTALAPSTANVLSNGQTSLAVLLLVVGAPLLLRNEKLAGVVAALGMFKVSLFLPFVGVFVAAKRQLLVASLVASSLYGLFGVIWLRVSPLETIFGPLRIASELSGRGYASRSGGDVHRLLFDLGVEPTTLISALLGGVSVLIPWLVFRKSHNLGASVAAASLAALIFFPHFPYDYVFALPVLAFALSSGLSISSGLLAASSGVLALSPRFFLRRLERFTGADFGAKRIFAFPMESVAANWYLAFNLASLLLVVLVATRQASVHVERTDPTLTS